MASMYAVYHGPAGLKRIAQRVHRLTATLAAGLEALGFARANATFFDTLTLETGFNTEAIHAAASARGINLRHAGATRVGVSLDETATREDVIALWRSSRMASPCRPRSPSMPSRPRRRTPSRRPARQSAYLTHPVFNTHHAEHEMLRYLRMLADKDLALDRTMIPLGSCTMKLNATSEMIPVTWPEFSRIHPFAPLTRPSVTAR